MPHIIRWSPRRTKKAQKNPTNKPNPKANQPKNRGFGYFGYLNSVKVDAEMGCAELCGGVAACRVGLCVGSCGVCLQLPARGNSAGSWASLMYILTCPDPAFGGAEAGGFPHLSWDPLHSPFSHGKHRGCRDGCSGAALTLCYSKGGKG